ncbi:glycosyltransferase [Trichococcus shcherbakoviae]|uniref:glycosyltransferase n=1 Tax=Trichococcus shcherbakoviae TaxID=2094020 RepID=UPI0029F5438F|nr:glycosyltransferase [Trichococcus shcherbakoviae]
MDSLVSIIVPVYNVEKYINKCIDSIIHQTYRNLQIILVDDGSTDNSAKIVDDYAKYDARIEVVHKANGGLSDARNSGLKISKGAHVCFIDSDDYVELDMIEKSLTTAIEKNADVVIFGLYNKVLDENEKVINNEAVIIDINNLDSMISIIGYAWNKLYKTSYLKNNEYTFQKGLSLVEDIVFNEYVLTNTDNIEYLNEQLYNYISRKRETLVKQYYDDSYDLHIIGFNARKKVIFKLFGFNDNTRGVVAKAHIDGIRYCCSNMFFYNNNLKITNKYENIKKILLDKVTTEQIKLFKPLNKSDKFIKASIVFNMPLLLCSAYYFKSIITVKKRIS